MIASPPKISDQLNAVCRTLDLTLQNVPGLKSEKGQTVQLFYKGKLQFEGPIFIRGYDASGSINLKAYDPLIFLRNTDDYYFKNITATQGIKNVAQRWGIKIGSIANTGAVLPALYYPASEGDRVVVDMLARTYGLNRRRYWLRYVPGSGLTVFERVVPSKIWAFQVGVNLTAADYEESIEETATIVKLVNRETGKTVTRTNTALKNKYGPLVHFEEVDKDQVNTMERKAENLLSSLGKVKVSQSIDGINPDGAMPMFYSGDLIYVEEKYTGLIGAYYIEDLTQNYVSESLVEISASVTKAANIPEIQYEDAKAKPDFLK
ncbi:XkdQ/YqbQ family protein [Cytobacillus kochii]|uniref:XkdQ/YqbQ family protein n=1 Tax=Cytobacillus kochii TaxID=859143 RepID=UPI00402A6215